MQWKFDADNTAPVLTAAAHIQSAHRGGGTPALPKTAVLFFMHGGEEYFLRNYSCGLITEKLPRFLRGGPVWRLSDGVCFLDGGRGAPQAADTVETLAALGVEKILSVGMFGALGSEVDTGDILVPSVAYVEEGTSLHYYSTLECAEPDGELSALAARLSGARCLPIVSTDAIYRQTYYKEQLWRTKDAVGVDMETSAVFSVSAYLGLKAAAVLIASDKHPQTEGAPRWQWHMTDEMRHGIFEKAKLIAESA